MIQDKSVHVYIRMKPQTKLLFHKESHGNICIINCFFSILKSYCDKSELSIVGWDDGTRAVGRGMTGRRNL